MVTATGLSVFFVALILSDDITSNLSELTSTPVTLASIASPYWSLPLTKSCASSPTCMVKLWAVSTFFSVPFTQISSMLLIVLVAYASANVLVPDTLPQVTVTVTVSSTAPGLTVTLPSLEMETLSLFSAFFGFTDQTTVGETTASSNAFLTEAVNAVFSVVAESVSPGIFTEPTPSETATLVATFSSFRSTINFASAEPVVACSFALALIVYSPAFALASTVMVPSATFTLPASGPLTDQVTFVTGILSFKTAVKVPTSVEPSVVTLAPVTTTFEIP